MAKAINGNWWKVVLAILIPLLGLAAAWGATLMQVNGISEKDIPALKQADESQCKGINANENAIIKIEGSLEALRVEQKTFHNESEKKLEAILKAVEKK